MPYCAIIENPDPGQEQFEQVKAHLRDAGTFPPPGQRLLIAGATDQGWRVISVWDSEEELERFYTEALPAAFAARDTHYDRMTRTSFEVQTSPATSLAPPIRHS